MTEVIIEQRTKDFENPKFLEEYEFNTDVKAIENVEKNEFG